VVRMWCVHRGEDVRPGRVDVRFSRNFLPTDEHTRLQMNVAAIAAGLKSREEVLAEEE